MGDQHQGIAQKIGAGAIGDKTGGFHLVHPFLVGRDEDIGGRARDDLLGKGVGPGIADDVTL